MISQKKGGGDIGNFEHSLSTYNFNSKANAAAVIGAIEFVKSSYESKFLGSQTLGHLLSLGRNIGIDLVDSSDLVKFNLLNFASGNYTHPSTYEWNHDN